MQLLSEQVEKLPARLAEEQQQETPEARSEAERKAELLRVAWARFEAAASAEAEQRRREIEDLKFSRALPADQWPEDVYKARQGREVNGQIVGARPCLTINRLGQPIRQTVAEARQAKLGIQIKPKGDGASKDGAELRQGLIRAIEVDSNAHQARMWALERAAVCGRGFYRILKTYLNDGDFDQDISIERILDQFSVYFDPNAKKPDWSDAEWVFITTDIAEDDYKLRWPDKPIGTGDADQLGGAGNPQPGWVAGEDGKRTIRVAEYFYIEHTARTLIYDPALTAVGVPNGRAFEDELTPEQKAAVTPFAKKRTIDAKTVQWAVINGLDVLDEERWDGRYLPVIPVIGQEFYVEGQRCFKGIVSDAKDAQRSYNYMRSAQVEAIALGNRAPYIVAEGQIEEYQEMWDSASTINYPYLVYKPVTLGGRPVPPPQRNIVEPAIQGVTLAVNEAAEDIRATTGRWEASLGQMNSQDRSGKAILALQQQGAQSSSIYLDNLASVSMTLEGKVLLDLIPKVYDRPGRIMRLLGDAKTDERVVVLGQPFVPGPDGLPQVVEPGAGPMGAGPSAGPMGMPPPGAPMPGPQGAPAPMGGPGMPPPPGMPMPGPAPAAPPKPKLYDLSTPGDYAVVVSVGPSDMTQRDANARLIEGLIQAMPELAPLVGDLWAESLDGPMATKVAERLRKVNPALANALENGEVSPAMVQALQAQLQQMAQAIQQLNEELKTQRYKVDAEKEMTAAKLAAERDLEEMRLNAQREIERMKIEAQAGLEVIKQQGVAKQQAAERAHGTAEASADRDHQSTLADQKAAHQVAADARRAALKPPQPPERQGAS
jgi:hypothetical protein